MRSYLVAFLLSILGFTSCSSKKLFFSEINKKIYLQPDLNIDSTRLQITREDGDYPLNSQYEKLYKDKRELHFTMIGLNISLILNFQEKDITPRIELFSDYNQYNGKNIKNLKLEDYTLVVNKETIKKQDTLYGKIYCLYNNDKNTFIKIKGEFKHIVGTGRIILKSGKIVLLDKPFNQ